MDWDDLGWKTRFKYNFWFWWNEVKEEPILRLLFMPITVPMALALLFLSLFYTDKGDRND